MMLMYVSRLLKTLSYIVGLILLAGLMVISPYTAISQKVTAVTSQEFFESYLDLFEDNRVIVIDGRTEKMFSEGCLGNAINIDADDPDLQHLLQPFLQQPVIVLYCTTDRRTNKIKDTLMGRYEGEIIYISDGIRGWRLNGFPVSGEPATERRSSPVIPTDTLNN